MIKLDFGSQIQQILKLLLGNQYNFLGFTLNLETCILTDNLSSSISKDYRKILEPLLNHYSYGTQAVFEDKLIKYKDIPGGYAYKSAFSIRAIQPIEHAFGKTPDLLIRAGEILKGKTLSIADFSTKIPALKGIPLTYILYAAEEFPASGNILYDKSASNYLPTEDLAVLGELTTLRLIEAKEYLTRKN